MAPTKKGSSPAKTIAAGGIAGAIEISCTYPIEYTKTMMQLSTTKTTAMDVVRNTVNQRGFLGMYKGLSSMLYFAAPKAAIRFSSKEQFSHILAPYSGTLGHASGFVAGLGAGVCEAVFVTTPQETIKVKLIDDQFKRATPRYKGTIHGIQTIIREEGIRECYKGLSPTIFKVATAQATRFGVFELVPSEFRTRSPLHTAASGAFAGGVSVLLFQGIDVVKSRMQGLDSHKYKNAIDCCKTMLREEGVMSFYKGVGPRLTRVCLEVAITMTLYGEVLKFVEKF
eukprot:GFYU01018566.1.p1 GENE.GFYU01018566.1~~GFYU01018566.1.p1  ORF type:complete len:283 (+),score=77.17 GFYU01018566.1:79-927(+)